MKKRIIAALLLMLALGLCGCRTAADVPAPAADNAPAAEQEDMAEPIELVNLRGDVIAAVRHSDGSCTDADGNVYTFDGVDTWTDGNGAEWNETVRQEN